MSAPIAFLHTSPVHVKTFSELLQRLRPGAIASHVVNDELLLRARELGHDHPDVIRHVQFAIHAIAKSGAAVIVCTCSAIGAAAESTPSDGSFAALRIDRAMADEAVRQGPIVLVAAALESTLAPTVSLIRDSARRLSLPVTVKTVLAANAWSHFEQGDIGAYLDLPTTVFKIIVGVILLLSAVRFMVRPSDDTANDPPSLSVAIPTGAGLGLLSGLTGTGGGIFLTPLLLMMRWSTAKPAAGVSALFILLNSIAGLLGNVSSTKNFPTYAIPLAIAAVVAGFAGAYFGSHRFPHATIKRMLLGVVFNCPCMVATGSARF